MKWRKINDYCLTNGNQFTSDCGKYRYGTHTISKAFVRGEPRYTLWIGEQPARMVGIHKTLDEAKSMAEKEVSNV